MGLSMHHLCLFTLTKEVMFRSPQWLLRQAPSPCDLNRLRVSLVAWLKTLIRYQFKLVLDSWSRPSMLKNCQGHWKAMRSKSFYLMCIPWTAILDIYDSQPVECLTPSPYVQGGIFHLEQLYVHLQSLLMWLVPHYPFQLSVTHRGHAIFLCALIFLWLQEEVPIVNFTATGVVRCRRCRTYVNPYVKFTEGGRKFRCNTCSLLNDGTIYIHVLHKFRIIKEESWPN